MTNPHAPRPPMIAALLALPDPEAEPEERPEPLMVPDPDLADWVEETFLDAESPLLITDHVELVGARIGFVWTNVERKSRGSGTLGTAQLGKPTRHHGDAWTVASLEQQRRDWFGVLPDLLVTLYAPWCARCEARQLAALIDHELRHFRPKVDADGETVYDEETGRPAWRVVGHDIEEFAGNAEHFGCWEPGMVRMREALNARPYFDADLLARFVGPPLLPWHP